MDEWRRFRLRYRGAIEEVHERYPGFWIELRDLAETRDRRRTTARGAVVREFPHTRDQGTQASGGRTLGQCLFGVGVPTGQDAGTQTGGTTRSTGIQTGDLPRVAAVEGHPTGRGRGRLFTCQAQRPPGRPEEDSPPPPPSIRPGDRTMTVREPGAMAPVRPPTRGSTTCWNCRATDHRYSTCPWPKERQYCYGCGRKGVTLRSGFR